MNQTIREGQEIKELGEKIEKNPLEIWKLIPACICTIYWNACEWVGEALLNEDAELKYFKELKRVNWGNIKKVIFEAVKTFPVAVQPVLQSFILGVEFVIELLTIYEQEITIDDKRIEISRLIRSHANLPDDMGTVFAVFSIAIENITSNN